MPGITLVVSGQPDADLTTQLATQLSDLTCQALRKELKHTSVTVRYQPRDQWFIAGQSLTESGKNAFRLDVTITDETNTKLEKANYHKAAFELLSKLIGNLHSHSNIHISDCRAAAYGFGGVTQEYRLHNIVG